LLQIKGVGKMGILFTELIFKFFVAFGIVIGASFFGMLGAFIIQQPLSEYVKPLTESVKIWALVVTLGGTIDPIRVIESGFLDGQLPPATKQVLVILVAFMGAHLATVLVSWLMGWEGRG
jgi:hypothetical protein